MKTKQRASPIGYLLLAAACYIWIFPVAAFNLHLPFVGPQAISLSVLLGGVFLATFLYQSLSMQPWARTMVSLTFACAVSFVMFYAMFFSGFAF